MARRFSLSTGLESKHCGANHYSTPDDHKSNTACSREIASYFPSDDSELSLTRSENSPQNGYRLKDQQSQLQQQLLSMKAEKRRIEDEAAILKEQTMRLEYELADAQEAARCREEVTVLLQTQLDQVEEKYIRCQAELDECRQGIRAQELELVHLKEACYQFEEEKEILNEIIKARDVEMENLDKALRDKDYDRILEITEQLKEKEKEHTEMRYHLVDLEREKQKSLENIMDLERRNEELEKKLEISMQKVQVLSQDIKSDSNEALWKELYEPCLCKIQQMTTGEKDFREGNQSHSAWISTTDEYRDELKEIIRRLDELRQNDTGQWQMRIEEEVGNAVLQLQDEYAKIGRSAANHNEQLEQMVQQLQRDLENSSQRQERLERELCQAQSELEAVRLMRNGTEPSCALIDEIRNLGGNMRDHTEQVRSQIDQRDGELSGKLEEMNEYHQTEIQLLESLQPNEDLRMKNTKLQCRCSKLEAQVMETNEMRWSSRSADSSELEALRQAYSEQEAELRDVKRELELAREEAFKGQTFLPTFNGGSSGSDRESKSTSNQVGTQSKKRLSIAGASVVNLLQASKSIAQQEENDGRSSPRRSLVQSKITLPFAEKSYGTVTMATPRRATFQSDSEEEDEEDRPRRFSTVSGQASTTQLSQEGSPRRRSTVGSFVSRSNVDLAKSRKSSVGLQQGDSDEENRNEASMADLRKAASNRRRSSVGRSKSIVPAASKSKASTSYISLSPSRRSSVGLSQYDLEEGNQENQASTTELPNDWFSPRRSSVGRSKSIMPAASKSYASRSNVDLSKPRKSSVGVQQSDSDEQNLNEASRTELPNDWFSPRRSSVGQSKIILPSPSKSFASRSNVDLSKSRKSSVGVQQSDSNEENLNEASMAELPNDGFSPRRSSVGQSKSILPAASKSYASRSNVDISKSRKSSVGVQQIDSDEQNLNEASRAELPNDWFSPRRSSVGRSKSIVPAASKSKASRSYISLSPSRRSSLGLEQRDSEEGSQENEASMAELPNGWFSPRGSSVGRSKSIVPAASKSKASRSYMSLSPSRMSSVGIQRSDSDEEERGENQGSAEELCNCSGESSPRRSSVAQSKIVLPSASKSYASHSNIALANSRKSSVGLQQSDTELTHFEENQASTTELPNDWFSPRRSSVGRSKSIVPATSKSKASRSNIGLAKSRKSSVGVEQRDLDEEDRGGNQSSMAKVLQDWFGPRQSVAHSKLILPSTSKSYASRSNISSSKSRKSSVGLDQSDSDEENRNEISMADLRNEASSRRLSSVGRSKSIVPAASKSKASRSNVDASKSRKSSVGLQQSDSEDENQENQASTTELPNDWFRPRRSSVGRSKSVMPAASKSKASRSNIGLAKSRKSSVGLEQRDSDEENGNGASRAELPNDWFSPRRSSVGRSKIIIPGGSKSNSSRSNIDLSKSRKSSVGLDQSDSDEENRNGASIADLRKRASRSRQSSVGRSKSIMPAASKSYASRSNVDISKSGISSFGLQQRDPEDGNLGENEASTADLPTWLNPRRSVMQSTATLPSASKSFASRSNISVAKSRRSTFGLQQSELEEEDVGENQESADELCSCSGGSSPRRGSVDRSQIMLPAASKSYASHSYIALTKPRKSSVGLEKPDSEEGNQENQASTTELPSNWFSPRRSSVGRSKSIVPSPGNTYASSSNMSLSKARKSSVGVQRNDSDKENRNEASMAELRNEASSRRRSSVGRSKSIVPAVSKSKASRSNISLAKSRKSSVGLQQSDSEDENQENQASTTELPNDWFSPRRSSVGRSKSVMPAASKSKASRSNISLAKSPKSSVGLEQSDSDEENRNEASMAELRNEASSRRRSSVGRSKSIVPAANKSYAARSNVDTSKSRKSSVGVQQSDSDEENANGALMTELPNDWFSPRRSSVGRSKSIVPAASKSKASRSNIGLAKSRKSSVGLEQRDLDEENQENQASTTELPNDWFSPRRSSVGQSKIILPSPSKSNLSRSNIDLSKSRKSSVGVQQNESDEENRNGASMADLRKEASSRRLSSVGRSKSISPDASKSKASSSNIGLAKSRKSSVGLQQSDSDDENGNGASMAELPNDWFSPRGSSVGRSKSIVPAASKSKASRSNIGLAKSRKSSVGLEQRDSDEENQENQASTTELPNDWFSPRRSSVGQSKIILPSPSKSNLSRSNVDISKSRKSSVGLQQIDLDEENRNEVSIAELRNEASSRRRSSVGRSKSIMPAASKSKASRSNIGLSKSRKSSVGLEQSDSEEENQGEDRASRAELPNDWFSPRRSSVGQSKIILPSANKSNAPRSKASSVKSQKSSIGSKQSNSLDGGKPDKSKRPDQSIGRIQPPPDEDGVSTIDASTIDDEDCGCDPLSSIKTTQMESKRETCQSEVSEGKVIKAEKYCAQQETIIVESCSGGSKSIATCGTIAEEKSKEKSSCRIQEFDSEKEVGLHMPKSNVTVELNKGCSKTCTAQNGSSYVEKSKDDYQRQINDLEQKVREENTVRFALEEKVNRMSYDLLEKGQLERELDILRHRLEQDFVSRYELEQMRQTYEMELTNIKLDTEKSACNKQKGCKPSTTISPEYQEARLKLTSEVAGVQQTLRAEKKEELARQSQEERRCSTNLPACHAKDNLSLTKPSCNSPDKTPCRTTAQKSDERTCQSSGIVNRTSCQISESSDLNPCQAKKIRHPSSVKNRCKSIDRTCGTVESSSCQSSGSSFSNPCQILRTRAEKSQFGSTDSTCGTVESASCQISGSSNLNPCQAEKILPTCSEKNRRKSPEKTCGTVESSSCQSSRSSSSNPCQAEKILPTCSEKNRRKSPERTCGTVESTSCQTSGRFDLNPCQAEKILPSCSEKNRLKSPERTCGTVESTSCQTSGRFDLNPCQAEKILPTCSEKSRCGSTERTCATDRSTSSQSSRSSELKSYQAVKIPCTDETCGIDVKTISQSSRSSALKSYQEDINPCTDETCGIDVKKSSQSSKSSTSNSCQAEKSPCTSREKNLLLSTERTCGTDLKTSSKCSRTSALKSCHVEESPCTSSEKNLCGSSETSCGTVIKTSSQSSRSCESIPCQVAVPQKVETTSCKPPQEQPRSCQKPEEPPKSNFFSRFRRKSPARKAEVCCKPEAEAPPKAKHKSRFFMSGRRKSQDPAQKEEKAKPCRPEQPPASSIFTRAKHEQVRKAESSNESHTSCSSQQSSTCSEKPAPSPKDCQTTCSETPITCTEKQEPKIECRSPGSIFTRHKLPEPQPLADDCLSTCSSPLKKSTCSDKQVYPAKECQSPCTLPQPKQTCTVKQAFAPKECHSPCTLPQPKQTCTVKQAFAPKECHSPCTLPQPKQTWHPVTPNDCHSTCSDTPITCTVKQEPKIEHRSPGSLFTQRKLSDPQPQPLEDDCLSACSLPHPKCPPEKKAPPLKESYSPCTLPQPKPICTIKAPPLKESYSPCTLPQPKPTCILKAPPPRESHSPCALPQSRETWHAVTPKDCYSTCSDTPITCTVKQEPKVEHRSPGSLFTQRRLSEPQSQPLDDDCLSACSLPHPKCPPQKKAPPPKEYYSPCTVQQPKQRCTVHAPPLRESQSPCTLPQPKATCTVHAAPPRESHAPCTVQQPKQRCTVHARPLRESHSPCTLPQPRETWHSVTPKDCHSTCSIPHLTCTEKQEPKIECRSPGSIFQQRKAPPPQVLPDECLSACSLPHTKCPPEKKAPSLKECHSPCTLPQPKQTCTVQRVVCNLPQPEPICSVKHCSLPSPEAVCTVKQVACSLPRPEPISIVKHSSLPPPETVCTVKQVACTLPRPEPISSVKHVVCTLPPPESTWHSVTPKECHATCSEPRLICTEELVRTNIEYRSPESIFIHRPSTEKPEFFEDECLSACSLPHPTCPPEKQTFLKKECASPCTLPQPKPVCTIKAPPVRECSSSCSLPQPEPMCTIKAPPLQECNSPCTLPQPKSTWHAVTPKDCHSSCSDPHLTCTEDHDYANNEYRSPGSIFKHRPSKEKPEYYEDECLSACSFPNPKCPPEKQTFVKKENPSCVSRSYTASCSEKEFLPEREYHSSRCKYTQQEPTFPETEGHPSSLRKQTHSSNGTAGYKRNNVHIRIEESSNDESPSRKSKPPHDDRQMNSSLNR